MSEADEMFLKTNFVNKEEYIEKGKCKRTKYSDERNSEFIIFYHYSKEIKIDAILNTQELQAINEKCKELGWIK